MTRNPSSPVPATRRASGTSTGPRPGHPTGKLTPFAVLKHGEWYEQGEMGWFGVAANMLDDAAWEEEVSRLLADVPADELVSVYDCHI